MITLLGKKQKYHKGKYFTQQWFFEISDQVNHKRFITEVNIRRQRNTTFHHPGKNFFSYEMYIITSDGWLAYLDLKKSEFKQSVVIHNKEFVNMNGDQTKNVESIWPETKD